MMIRQDFERLPPKMYMMQIMDSLVKTYVFLWDKKDDENRIEMTWKDISMYYNKNSFRTSLRKLNNEALLNYNESSEGILIEMVGWDETFDEE
jgi:hypothetical protein